MGIRTKNISAFAISALLLAACGGSDESTPADDDTASVEEDAAAVEDGTSGDGEVTDSVEPADAASESNCDPTSGTFETVDGSISAAPMHAVAARIEGGAAYTVYLAERELAVDDISAFGGPEAAAGDVIVALAITTFNAETLPPPIEAGESVAYTSDFGVRTFVVTADLGGDFLGTNNDAAGSVTVTNVDGNLCGEVSYTDGEKSLTAVFDAPTKDL